MDLRVIRFSTGKESTLGYLAVAEGTRQQFLCFTLEDQHHTKKVYGVTRIPAGRYRLTLRTEGGKHKRYAEKFGKLHKGMLWIRDVPDYKYVLIHIGNRAKDTEGCLLVGDAAIQNVTRDGCVPSSGNAYRRIYPKIARAIKRGDDVTITYFDEDWGA